MGPVWLIKLRGAKGGNLGLRVNFPGDPVVKNLPSNAWDTGSIAGQGTKILCPAGQLNPENFQLIRPVCDLWASHPHWVSVLSNSKFSLQTAYRD